MKVIFLPKTGKDNYGKAKSYRPITLSNFLLKGLERLIQWYVSDFVLTKPLFAQHAYTVGKSCDSAVSEVLDIIEKNMLRRRTHVLAVSLDCSGAFDRIQFTSAKKAMEGKKIPEGIINLYQHILTARQVKANLQGEEMIRVPKRGSPQGGVLSPLIWNLIMDTILPEFRAGAVRVVGYADDIILLVGGKDPGTLVDTMNAALKKVLKWGQENGLIFNPDKTCAVRFTKAKKFSKWRDLQMNGKTLNYEDSMKYLGVTLQNRMSWRLHVHERIAKSTKIMNLANAAIGQKWGFNPERALWVYTAMARSVSTYGAIAWSNSITETIKKQLSRLQRKALLAMSSSMRSTPTAGMEVALGLMPLDLHTHMVGTNARARTRNTLTDTWDGIGDTGVGHKRLYDKILHKICPKNLPVDEVTSQRDWITNDMVDNPDLTLFTDGSKMECGTGAGWAVCHKDNVIAEESTYLGEDTTVFQAEVIAIERGLRWIISNCMDSIKLKVRSDSQSAIMAILSNTTSSKIVLGCKKVLRQAKENHRIALEWIKGHADFTGNELADLLAREGSSMKCDSVYPEVPVPRSMIKYKINQYFVAEWQVRYTASPGCQQTKIFFPKVDAKKIKRTGKMSRNNLNLLIQAGTGHALVAAHISKWTGTEITCKLCGESPETTEHLYFQCPRLELDRRHYAQCDLTEERRIISFFSMRALVDLFEERSRGCQARLQQRFQG